MQGKGPEEVIEKYAKNIKGRELVTKGDHVQVSKLGILPKPQAQPLLHGHPQTSLSPLCNSGSSSKVGN